MKRRIMTAALLALAMPVLADDVSKSNRMVCATAEVVACAEGGDCMTILPWEIDVPQFVVVDTRKKSIATTKASGENRSTPIQTLFRADAQIILQGIEQGRAFSIVIDEATGLLSAAVARDGFTISVFGACTDADI